MRMKAKRLLAVVLVVALCLPFLLLENTQATDAVPVISVSNVSAEAGDTVDVDILLKNNPGITSMTLNVTYDQTALTLVNVQNTGLLEGASFVKSPSMDNNPYRLIWNIGTSDSKAKGTLVTLSFQISDNVTGNYEIGISCQEDDIYNTSMQNVNFNLVSGTVSVETTKPDTPESEQPAFSTQPSPESPSTPPLGGEPTIYGWNEWHGWDVQDNRFESVTIELCNNPGITSLTLEITYDREVLTLVDVHDNDLFHGSSFVTSPSLDSYPFHMIWNVGTSDVYNDGRLVELEFKISKHAKPGDYEVRIAYEEDDIYNTSLENVKFDIHNATITLHDDDFPSTSSEEPADTLKPATSQKPAESQKPSGIIMGNLNNDNKVTLADAQITLKAALNLMGLSNLQKLAADVDKDGSVTLKDAQLILKYALNLINKF